MADPRASRRDARAKEVFLAAVELPEEERGAFLEARCGADAELRGRVQTLLTSDARAASIDALVPDTAPEPEAPLALVGDYELLGVLGRGAAGTVYRARQTSLRREVALKVLRVGSLASEGEVRRFRREAEAAAALDHPSIVPVYDIGAVDEHHFFSMRRVDGPSLDQVVGRFKADPRAATEVVEAVARAVHHAHRRGVLHRDVKPSNILLDEQGAPHVADFGIARPLGEAHITQTGLLCGTPAYMSPEQARGDRDVTVATDIWSLGCVLHELLAGAPPFDGEGGVAAVLRRVQEEDPPRMAGVHRDLATIVATCLNKDPGRRYPSALALAEDLRRWRDHEPITARPATRAERLRLVYKRNPLAVTLAVVVGVLLVVLGVGAGGTSLVMARRLGETRAALRDALMANAQAVRQSDVAGRRAQGLGLLQEAAAIAPGGDLRDEAITTLTLPDLAVRSSWPLPDRTALLAGDAGLERVLLGTQGGALVLVEAASGAVLGRSGADPRRVVRAAFAGEDLWVQRAGPQPELERWSLEGSELRREVAREGSAAWVAAGGGRVAVARGAAGAVDLLDATTGDLLGTHAVDGPAHACGFDPGGRHLAVSTGDDGVIVVLEVPGGAPAARLEHADRVRELAWSLDGRFLLGTCDDQRLYVWSTADWSLRGHLVGHAGELVAVRALAEGLALTQAWDGTTRLWDVEGARELLRTTRSPAVVAADGRRALLVDGGGLVSHVDVRSGDYLRVLEAHEGKAPREVAQSPDGRWLATSGDDGWLLWDADGPTPRARALAEPVHSVFFRGAEVVTSGDDGVLAWPLVDGLVGTSRVLVDGPSLRAAASPDGRWIGVVDQRRTFRLLGPDGAVREVAAETGLDRVTFSPDGARVAVGSWAGSGVRVWRTATGELEDHLLADEAVTMPAFTPTGEHLVVTTLDRIELVRCAGWEVERSLPRQGPFPVPATFARDLTAVGVGPNRVRLLRADDWTPVGDLAPASLHHTFHLCFLDEGRRLAIATPGQRLAVWDLAALADELRQRGLVGPDVPGWATSR